MRLIQRTIKMCKRAQTLHVFVSNNTAKTKSKTVPQKNTFICVLSLSHNGMFSKTYFRFPESHSFVTIIKNWDTGNDKQIKNRHQVFAVSNVSVPGAQPAKKTYCGYSLIKEFLAESFGEKLGVQHVFKWHWCGRMEYGG